MIGKVSMMLLILLLSSQLPLLGSEPEWKTDWEKELPLAAAQNQPVLMDFYTDWCPHCKRLDKTTFIDQGVLEFFKTQKYVLLKVNPEKDRPAEEKFKVFSYPTLIVFNSKGEEIDRILGFRDNKQLLQELTDAQNGIGTLEDLLSQYKKCQGQAIEENFTLLSKIINKYIARADYPKALDLVDETVRLDEDNKLGKAAPALSTKGYIYYKWKKLREAVNIMMDIYRRYPHAKEAEYGFQAANHYAKKLNDKHLQLQVLKKYVSAYPASEDAQKVKKEIENLKKE